MAVLFCGGSSCHIWTRLNSGIVFVLGIRPLLRLWVKGDINIMSSNYGCIYHLLPLRNSVSTHTYRTPLYKCDLRDVALINSSRFKKKASSLRNCFAPFDQGSRELLGGQLEGTAHGSRYFSAPEISLGRSDMYVLFQNSFAFNISQERDSGLFSQSKHTFSAFQYTHI